MRSPWLSTLLPLLLAAAAPVFGGERSATHAHVTSQRWATDPPLREGMSRLRAEVVGLEHYQHGHIGPQQAVILAGDIERDVGFVVTHCSLAPKADAALHLILVALLRGAHAIQSNPVDVAAIEPMRRALQAYPKRFDDPDWRAME